MGRIFNKTSITVGFDITNNKQPIDSRFIIDDINNIFLPNSWIRDDNTPIIPYKGLIVCDYNGNAMSCINDSSEVVNDNGTNKPTYCLKSSWKLLGNLTDTYDIAGSSEVALSSLGAFNMYSYLLGKITTLEGSISTNETILAMQEEIRTLQNRCTELESLLNWKDTVSPVPPTPVQTEEPVQGLIEEAEAIQDEINVSTYAVRNLTNRVSFNNPETNIVSTTTATPYTTKMPVKQDIYTIMENIDNTIVTLENEYNTLENKFTFNTDNKVTNTTTQIKLRTISKVENKSTNIKDQIEHKQNIIASLTDKLESLLNKISFN